MMEEEVIIQDVAFGGSGVGRLSNGKAVFVPRTLTGEKVRIRTLKEHKGFVEAEGLAILESSPQRVAPPCPYFSRCGGCAYQHAAYEEQLRIKKKQLRDALTRIGGFKELPPLHVEASPQPFGYRNKIVLHGDEKGRLGYYFIGNRKIVDIEKCLIAGDSINEQLNSIRKKRNHRTHLTLTDRSQRDLEEGFHQVNTLMAGKILEWVKREFEGELQTPPDARRSALNEKKPRLLDLYCGAGFFALGLASSFSEVCGMDRDPRAIHAAIRRAQAMGMKQARFFAGDISEKIEWILETQLPDAGVVLLDPPREGLDRRVIGSLLKFQKASPLIYISCNPATLARDLKLFAEKFDIVKLALFDMFPQTAHIEAGAILKNRF